MTGEEMAGPAGPKMVRLLCFVGSGFICSIAINKWRELERKSLQKKQQDINLLTDDSDNAPKVCSIYISHRRRERPRNSLVVDRVAKMKLDLLAFQLCKKKKWLAP